MNRLAVIPITALLLAGCSEPTAAPATGAFSGPSLAIGTPPPPPLTGDGSATLVVGVADALSFASALVTNAASVGCSAQTSFTFTYDYFINPQNSNSFLHMKLGDASREVTIHQTIEKSDAHGAIGGPDFSFDITDAITTDIVGPHGGAATHFSAQVTGTLTHADGSTCQASAEISGFLGGHGGIGGV